MNKDRVLYITNKDGAVLTKLRERDGVSDCYIDNKQNAESTLSFSMLIKSDKYQFLSNAENLIIADNRVYTQLYDGESVNEKKGTDNKNTSAISLVERQYLLGKAFVTTHNSTTTYDHIDNTMVVLLSGGAAPLVVNGVEVVNPYTKGTAAYALYAVLYGTGWAIDTVDVDGVFDLETSKKSILENVKAIQELWGGILVFDSFNKKIGLRSETIYQPYNGYGARFKFNETGIERNINKNVVTRLYVYGKDGLNISSSNNGLEYLENYTYTSTPLYGLIENNDISNVGDLIVYGTRELEKMCKPQVTLKAPLIDRSQLEGGISFAVSDMVDVVDEDLSESRYRARVTEKKYNFFRPWECSSVTLGDEKEVFAAKIKYALNSANKINNLINLVGQVSSDNVTMSGSRQTMTSYVQLTNQALEAGFKVIGVDGYERTGKTSISVDGIDIYNGGIVVRDRQNDIKIYMDGTTGNIIFAGNLHGASGTFKGALEAATGTFTGKLIAATGDFSGSITAESGYIGSWQILNGGIVNITNSLALTAIGEIVAANGNFNVDSAGKLTATGAELNGSFKANDNNSSVEFSDENMVISFVNKNETGVVVNACKISPTEFYFKVFDANGNVTSGIEYANGSLVITGSFSAATGEIGGWVITPDGIKAPNDSMTLNPDGTIEASDGAGDSVGKIRTTKGNERTEISGGRINMFYHDVTGDHEDESGNIVENWVPEGSAYTNSIFGGGLCMESKETRPIVFAVGGYSVAFIEPGDYEDNTSGETRFNFRNGSYLYQNKIETGYVKETNPEWFSNIAASSNALVFTSGNRTVVSGETTVAKTYTYSLEKDTDGRITSYTDESGHITTITRS